MKQALEKLLLNFKGTILFVSHDRYFVNKLATSLVVFEDGNSRFLKDMTYSEYEKSLREKSSGVIKEERRNKPIAEEKPKSESQNLYLLKRKSKRSIAKSYIEGFKYCIDLGCKRFIQMDADFSHNPRYLPVIIEKFNVAEEKYIQKS